MTFGETLRKLRQEKGLSQQQLAKMVFVDRTSVTRWESGNRLPDAMMIMRLSECLGADVTDLLSAAKGLDGVPNVILVDDEKIILRGGLPILERAFPNAAVTGFTRPLQAISFARENRVDLAFLDIETGSLNGIELCRQLLDIHSRTNIIFLTAFPDYSLDAWSTGACGFLIKPLSVEAVRRQLPFLRYPVRGLNNE